MSEFKKRVMSDIVPPQKKVVFSAPIPPPRKNFDPKFKIPKLKIILLFSLIVLLYSAVSVVFAEMKVEIAPKNFSLSLDETLSLSKKPTSGKIFFSEISLSDKKSGSFSSSQKRSIESKAKGLITVVNKNPSSQVLVAGTRFESSSGKIYKIEKSIVVPQNGSADIEVLAQNPGTEFNEEYIVDFTIPGFKEQRSPKFKTVYAKSKTKITGGFSGETLVVGQEDVKNAKNSILNSAISETSQSLTRKTPDDSFLLAQSIRYNVVEENSEPAVGQAGDKFTIRINGSVSGVVVNRESLEKALGKKIPNYDDSNFHYKMKNMDKISFELSNFKTGSSEFELKAKGVAEFVGVIDPDLAQENIFEKKLKKSSAILEAFPAASRVKVRFRPFWLRSFPDTKERIKISVN